MKVMHLYAAGILKCTPPHPRNLAQSCRDWLVPQALSSSPSCSFWVSILPLPSFASGQAPSPLVGSSPSTTLASLGAIFAAGFLGQLLFSANSDPLSFFPQVVLVCFGLSSLGISVRSFVLFHIFSSSALANSDFLCFLTLGSLGNRMPGEDCVDVVGSWQPLDTLVLWEHLQSQPLASPFLPCD